MEHTKGLNPAQKEAALTTEGPVLVLAGAGAGKTKTIAHRISHIVNGGTSPYRILAITFTNKAAREMRERVLGLLQEQGAAHGSPTVTTFHALAALLLREHAEVLGLKRSFTIYDRSDSLRAMKRAVKEAGEDPKVVEPRAILSSIGRAKSDAITLSNYRDATGNGWWEQTVTSVWERYEKLVRSEGALDFDDLLLYLWLLLERHADVRTKLQARYTYIHVDEYQDTNKVQYNIVRLLAGEQANIFCVGDLDQNVYSWRGATIENILDFERAFPNAVTIRLEQNYRSTKTIVNVSNEIIKKNVRRKEKTLFTDNAEGDRIGLISGFDERHEADLLAGRAAELIERGASPSEIAVLYRANFQSRVLEDAFLAADIPYRVLGTRFFDRKEVKDTLSYLRAAQNTDSWADIARTINTPQRGIGKVTFEKLQQQGIEGLTGKARERVEEYFAILARIRTYLREYPCSEAIKHTLSASGIERMLTTGSEEDEERLQNVKELASLAATRYDALPGQEGVERLLEDAALATDQDEMDARTGERDRNAVTLLTVHAAKGLEFDHVFVTGLEDGLFPHEQLDTRGTKDAEEERRLFYVALTRARTNLYLTYAQVRTVFGQRLPRMPSQFLLDIDEQYMETSESTQATTGQVVYLD